MCHDSAIEILGTFIKIENAVKSKKPANLTICRLYHVFLRVFEKIEKLSFRLLLPFWWGFLKVSNLNLPDLGFAGSQVYKIPMCHDSATKLKVLIYFCLMNSHLNLMEEKELPLQSYCL
jgi:hypothetical protein